MKSNDNIVGKINLILLNIPENVSDLAKVRYVYKMLGNLFSYDFSIIIDEEVALKDVDFDEIERYQTCTQIAKIFNVILNNINETSKAKIIARHLNNNSHHTYEHLANEVCFTDSKTGLEYKLLLDLTLDLYRIQSGMQTRQFAFTTDALGTYDIISLNECEQLDKELGLFEPKGYTDKEIKNIAELLEKDPASTKQKLFSMWNILSKTFGGAHEAKQYYENLISTIFPSIAFNSYNMYYKDISTKEFASLFIIHAEEDIYVLLDNKLGVVFSSKEKIYNMMKFGWKTSSNTLADVIGYNPYNDNIHMGI